MACGPEFSVEFSAPPEFSSGVTEKYLSTGWARTFDLQIRKQLFYHCTTAPLCTKSYDYQCVHSWDFPAVSVFTGSQIFQPYLVATCRDFPAVSAVTGSQNFPAVSGSYLLFRPYLQLLAAEFSGRICSYLPGFSGLTFSGTRRPGFSGRICCFWPGFSCRSFSGMGKLKKTLRAAGKLFWYPQRDFLSLILEFSGGKLKQKGFFSQCIEAIFRLKTVCAYFTRIVYIKYI